jgi:hypothetical protein
MATFRIGSCRRPIRLFRATGIFGSSKSSSKSMATMSSVIASTCPMLPPTLPCFSWCRIFLRLPASARIGPSSAAASPSADRSPN